MLLDEIFAQFVERASDHSHGAGNTGKSSGPRTTR